MKKSLAFIIATLIQLPLISCAQVAVKAPVAVKPPAGIISAPGFKLSSSPNPVTVQAGGSSVNVTITVSSSGNFSAPVTLSESDNTVGMSYSFSPNPVTPPANGTITSTLTITASSLATGVTCPTGVFPGVSGVNSGVRVNVNPPLCVTVLPAGGTQPLTITINGNGTVTSTPAGINCPLTCTFNYPTGTNVTLTATPGTGVLFEIWGGACIGSGACAFTINSPTNVSATFSPPVVYNARTDGTVFGTNLFGEVMPKETCGASSDNCGFTGGNVACLQNAFNPCSSTHGHQGDKLVYDGAPTTNPPIQGDVIAGTNMFGLNSYSVGVNSSVMPMTDPDFNTQIIRVTDRSMYNNVSCLGAGKFGESFTLGSGGGVNIWGGPDSNNNYRLLVISASAGQNLLVINPTTHLVTPTDICGGYLPGRATVSSLNIHKYYTLVNDFESTVTYTSITGSPITNEIFTNGNATAVLQAINLASNFAQFGLVTTGGGPCPFVSNLVWTGAQSGATITVTANPPCGTSTGNAQAVTYSFNGIYEGVLCDGSADPVEVACGTQNGWFGLGNPTCSNAGNSTNPACWYIQWKLLFAFNYIPNAPDTVHFPQAPGNCLPQNYPGNYRGEFIISDLDQTATITFGDTGQVTITGQSGATAQSCKNALGSGAIGNSGSHVCTGPVYLTTYTQNGPGGVAGCRVMNTMTEQIAGDFGPTGLATNGNAFTINGSIAGTLTSGDYLVQTGTNASTQLLCQTGFTQSCTEVTGTGILTGFIWGTPNGSNTWQDCGNVLPLVCTGNILTPAGLPQPAPFYYPDVMHDSSQTDDPAVTEPTWVQSSNPKVTSVRHFSASNQTFFTYGSGITNCNQSNPCYSWGQQLIFSGLAGTDDQYLNCVSYDHCPVWTIIAGGNSGTGIYISDATAVGDYTDPESQSGCGGHLQPNCPTASPNGQAPQSGFWGLASNGGGGFAGLMYWQTYGTTMNADYQGTGHHATGYDLVYQGKLYTAFNIYNPILPCTTTGLPGGPNYLGPAAACPPNMNINLLFTSIQDDQHGTNNNAGISDFAPVGFSSTFVCNLSSSNGVFLCPPTYTGLWDTEIIGIENPIARSSPGNPQGLDCQYTSAGTPLPCVYRWGHSFGTSTNWNFGPQNQIANISPDGLLMAVPSDWNLTTGCMDANINPNSTNCWPSWFASLPPEGFSNTSTSWSTDGSGNVTVNIPNNLCPFNGVQYIPTANCGNGGCGGTVSCGNASTPPMIVTMSGWTGGNTFLNGKATIKSNPGNTWGCTAGAALPNCNSFIVVMNNFTTCGAWGHCSTSGSNSGGTQKVTPQGCGVGIPCQAADIYVYLLQTAHK